MQYKKSVVRSRNPHSHSHLHVHEPPVQQHFSTSKNDLQVNIQRLQIENRNLQQVLNMFVNMSGWINMQSPMINCSNNNNICRRPTHTSVNTINHFCEQQYASSSHSWHQQHCHYTQQHNISNKTMDGNNQEYIGIINNGYFNTAMVGYSNADMQVQQDNQRQEEQVGSNHHFQNAGTCDIVSNFTNDSSSSSQILDQTVLAMENSNDIIMQQTSLPFISGYSSIPSFENILFLPSISEENDSISVGDMFRTVGGNTDVFMDLNADTVADVNVSNTASNFEEFSFCNRSFSTFTPFDNEENDIINVNECF